MTKEELLEFLSSQGLEEFECMIRFGPFTLFINAATYDRLTVESEFLFRALSAYLAGARENKEVH